jgi:MarR family transcriptional regulator for hemolysin
MTFEPLAKMPLNKRVAFLILDTGRLIRNRVDQVTGEAGLTMAQWRVLATVASCRAARQEPPNQAALADLLEIEPITLSRQIDRLAAAGLIERQPDPADRRAHQLVLTDKATPLVEEFRERGNKLLLEALAGISDKEIEGVVATLERLRTNLTGRSDTIVPFAAPQSRKKKSVLQ